MSFKSALCQYRYAAQVPAGANNKQTGDVHMPRYHLKLSAAILSFAIAPLAHAQSTADRTVLPIPAPAFSGQIAPNVLDARPALLSPLRAPQQAPNLFVFMSDDVGFSASSTFGGPVPTPNYDRLAARGQKYNRFHTTGICSPTRAALLTGRNHHNASVGMLSDMPAGFPGYTGAISPETATMAQVLKLNGYNTAMFGKHHNTPSDQRSVAGPFDNWPTGLGFEYFYGFNGGDSDQYRPVLYRGTGMLPEPAKESVLLDKRLADDAINWIHNQKAAAPDKPFFIYYASGSLHAPHQASPEHIARFKGKFDQGWDKVREETHKRQLKLGIIPAGTKLTPRPEGIPAWADLTADARAFAIKSMEVAAAMLAYQDEQLGRVLDELERMGLQDDTLVAVIEGDNGASAEVGPSGSVNELQHLLGTKEDDAWLASNVEGYGGEQTYGTYPAGWAWALNSPLRQMKQYASMLGGIRNGMILSWPGRIAKPGKVCAQFSHVIDIAPTFFEAAGVPAPTSVLGTTQKPLDGQSLLGSLNGCERDKPRTQYFEMTGKAGLYHNGWFASNEDGRKPWESMPPGGPRPENPWTLYDLRKDFSQNDDVAAENPEKLKELVALWTSEATRNNVFPLDHRFYFARAGAESLGKPAEHLEFWGKNVSIPATTSLPPAKSFHLDADLQLDKSEASGVIVAYGSHFGGWSFHLDKGKPVLTYARSTRPEDIVVIGSGHALPAGASEVGLNFNLERPLGKATVEILVDGNVVGSGTIAHTTPIPAGIGEMLDIGRDTGVTVTSYIRMLGEIEGDIPHVLFTFK
ncbi:MULTISPECIES: arylsulfatase [unclassified Novosphingobium]|uniref:arylsulfatase n=1 Tax=unclassified Novosphingobium TaxID=2644732 RepID=UPI001F42DC33|nr:MULTISPECIES: arylsulfatase [unclassified Novosphingobium]